MTNAALELLPGLSDAPIWMLGDRNKRPQWPHTSQQDRLYTLQEANDRVTDTHPYVGVSLRQETLFIIMDVDVDPTGKKPNATKEIPQFVTTFIQQHPTYVDRTASGYGLRIIYKVSAQDKETINLISKEYYDEQQTFKGQVYIGRATYAEPTKGNFVIITGDIISGHAYPIAELSLAALQTLTPTLRSNLQSIQHTATQQLASVTNLPPNTEQLQKDLQDLTHALNIIPADETSYLVNAYKELRRHEYTTSYDHWLTIGMGMAHSVVYNHADDLYINRFGKLFLKWSLTHSKPASEEDIIDKWIGFVASTRDKGASTKTLLDVGTIILLAKAMRPVLPDLNFKGNINYNSTVNIKAAIDFHKVKLLLSVYENSSFYVNCSKDTYNRLFKILNNPPIILQDGSVAIELRHEASAKLLVPKRILEESGWDTTPRDITNTAYAMLQQGPDRGANKDMFDPFKEWVASTPCDDPKHFNQLMDAIELDPLLSEGEPEYQRGIWHKWLYHMVGVHFTKNQAPAPVMPISVGPEYNGKSMFWKALLKDTGFDHRVVNLTPYFAAKHPNTEKLDRVLLSGIIGYVSEGNVNLGSADLIKALLGEGNINARALFTDKTVVVKSLVAVCSDANQADFKLSRSGNRRYAPMNIFKYDLNAVDAVDKQQLFAYFRHLQLNTDNLYPWDLSPEEIKFGGNLLYEEKAESEGDILLEDFLATRNAAPFDKDMLLQYTTKQGSILQPAQIKQHNMNNPDTACMFLLRDVAAMFKAHIFNTSNDTRVPNMAAIKNMLREFSKHYTNTASKRTIINDLVIAAGVVRGQGRTKYYIIPPAKGDSK